MGVAPAQPGIPDRHSRPARPSATQPATTASQSSPAATVSSTASRPFPSAPGPPAPGPPAPSSRTPFVAMRTTVPGKPASATTRLLPPPRTSSGSPRSSAVRPASTTCSRASARGTGARSPAVMCCRTRAPWSGQAHDRAGAGQYLGLTAARGQAEYHPVAVELLLDGPADLDGGARIVVGDDHRGGEPDPELDHRPGVPGPVGDVPARLGHGEHAVRDDVRQADRPRDPLVPVDDVEVPGCAAVLDQAQPGHRVAHGGQLGPGCNVRVAGGTAHSAPRSTSVEKPVQTCSPSTVRICVSVVSMVMGPTSRMAEIVDCAVTTSPARSGREYSNRCSPWTTIA